MRLEHARARRTGRLQGSFKGGAYAPPPCHSPGPPPYLSPEPGAPGSGARVVNDGPSAGTQRPAEPGGPGLRPGATRISRRPRTPDRSPQAPRPRRLSLKTLRTEFNPLFRRILLWG